MTPARPTDVPSAADVVALFQRALRQTEPEAADGVLRMLLDLHRNNLEQWRCEDTTRGVDASDATVAAAKRAIDAHNATRHVLVEAIDAALATPSNRTRRRHRPRRARRWSSTACRCSPSACTSPKRERVVTSSPAACRSLRDQLTTLQRALDGLFDDLRAGRKRFVPYQSLKLYGAGPTPEASTADTRPD